MGTKFGTKGRGKGEGGKCRFILQIGAGSIPSWGQFWAKKGLQGGCLPNEQAAELENRGKEEKKCQTTFDAKKKKIKQKRVMANKRKTKGLTSRFSKRGRLSTK